MRLKRNTTEDGKCKYSLIEHEKGGHIEHGLPHSENEFFVIKPKQKHPKCLGDVDYYGEFDCGYYTTILCEDCKYGLGRKDPEAKCNQ